MLEKPRGAVGLKVRLTEHDVPAATITGGRPLRPAGGVLFAEFEYGGTTIVVDSDQPLLEIGRDPACDLTVSGASVSHVHARVHWDRGRVKLEDVSTNGTIVERDEGSRIQAHHERIPLRGSGSLLLGVPGEGEAIIRYQCEGG